MNRIRMYQTFPINSLVLSHNPPKLVLGQTSESARPIHLKKSLAVESGVVAWVFSTRLYDEFVCCLSCHLFGFWSSFLTEEIHESRSTPGLYGRCAVAWETLGPFLQ